MYWSTYSMAAGSPDTVPSFSMPSLNLSGLIMLRKCADLLQRIALWTFHVLLVVPSSEVQVSLKSEYSPVSRSLMQVSSWSHSVRQSMGSLLLRVEVLRGAIHLVMVKLCHASVLEGSNGSRGTTTAFVRPLESSWLARVGIADHEQVQVTLEWPYSKAQASITMSI